jgi:hypothetical protein
MHAAPGSAEARAEPSGGRSDAGGSVRGDPGSPPGAGAAPLAPPGRGSARTARGRTRKVWVFTAVYGVLLRPGPFPEPDALVHVWETRVARGWDNASVTPAKFRDLLELNRSFEELGAFPVDVA